MTLEHNIDDVTASKKVMADDNSLEAQRKKAAKPLLWIGIASMAMMFAGLTSGYVVSRSSLVADDKWLTFELPKEFIISTVLVVLASIVLVVSVQFFKKNDSKKGSILSLIGLFLGIGFVVFQLMGWVNLYNSGIYFTGPGSNSAGSWVYAITLFHLLHVVAGLVANLVTTIKGFLGEYNSDNHLGPELNAIYWHFVDALWIYLFIFLSFIR